MIIPENVGLSLNHAMAFGCPVLSCKEKPQGPKHGPEIAYLRDGVNGFLVDDGDAKEIAKVVSDYFSHEKLQSELYAGALHTIYNEVTIKKMVDGFCEALTFVGKIREKKC